MDDYRSRLEHERDSVVRRLAALSHDFDEVVASSRDSNADDEHDPEGHTIAFERSQVSALVKQSKGHLAEVDAALDCVDAGTCGVCERCDRPIPEGRLKARPAARTCVGC